MMRVKHILPLVCAVVLGGAAVVSCLENDMGYPVTRGNITTFHVVGELSSSINNSTRSVDIELDETGDITAVVVDSAAISEGARCDYFPKPGDVIDFSSPQTYVISVYYDYTWTVTVNQTIERYVTCENQSSTPFFNVASKDVTVYVSDIQDLDSITFTDMKLEPNGSEILSTTGYTVVDGELVLETVDCTLPDVPMTLNCTLQRTFDVLYNGEIITWTMSVIQEAVPLEVTDIDAWTYHANVTGTFDGNGEPYFKYRKRGTSQWSTFEDVTVVGTTVTGTIPGDDTINEGSVRLSSGTEYEVEICVRDEESEPVTFKTEKPDQLKNMNFEDWYYDGKVWYPCSQGDYGTESQIWDTANSGSASFTSDNLTTPESDFTATPESNYAVRMKSRYAVIRFAAGNILTGEFLGVINLGADLNWGVPFTARPRAIRGYYSYSPGLVDYVENKKLSEDKINELDRCQILVILADWDEPFYVSTSNNIFLDHDNDPGIIAYLKFNSDEDTNGKYVYFEFELDYRRLRATPKYAVVIFCSSCEGDEFTGSTDSVMYVDEVEFVYD